MSSMGCVSGYQLGPEAQQALFGNVTLDAIRRMVLEHNQSADTELGGRVQTPLRGDDIGLSVLNSID